MVWMVSKVRVRSCILQPTQLTANFTGWSDLASRFSPHASRLTPHASRLRNNSKSLITHKIFLRTYMILQLIIW